MEQSITIEEYKQQMHRMLKMLYPSITNYELDLAIQYSIDKRFKNVDITVNTPFYNLLETFITNRTKFKNKMFEYPKGTEEFQKYNLLQLLAKIDCNAVYGILGQYSSMIYNLYLAQSVTFQGRACISAAILFFESFMADNVQWSCLNEIYR